MVTRTSNGPARGRAHFCSGDIRRHVLVMAGTGTIGLMAVFLVDLLNFTYISWLHRPALTAAIGFAGAVGYLQIAVSIGMTIGLGAAVGRMIGARRHDDARLTASSFLILMFGVSVLLGGSTAIFAAPILRLVGARGEALAQATHFLHLVSPALPLVAMGMGFSALMRTTGDARRSMNVTLAGAVATACLDPILIFALHLDLAGAAISTILSRALTMGLGYSGLRPHDLLCWPGWRAIPSRARPVATVALPAILTNIATPVGSAYVTNAMSGFGVDAVGGQATVERIVPVIFAYVYALTGSIGPIMSQNLGAGHIDRARQVLRVSLWMVAICVGVSWALLAAGHSLVIDLFSAQGDGVQIVRLFCCWTVASYFFVGMLFVANSAFNNLGHPLYSTSFNWGRATLGTIPFVAFGRQYGPQGVMIGQALGVTLFGLAAVLVAFRVMKRLKPAPVAPGVDLDMPTRSPDAAVMEMQE